MLPLFLAGALHAAHDSLTAGDGPYQAYVLLWKAFGRVLLSDTVAVLADPLDGALTGADVL